jgi:uncharacterized membrane protein YjdF
MADLEKIFFKKEFLEKWNSNYKKLEKAADSSGKAKGELDKELESWVAHQKNIKHLLPQELQDKLSALGVDLEDQGDPWEEMYRQLNQFVLKTGHSHVPLDSEYEALRDWLTRQIINKSLLTEEQFQKLDSVNVDWEMVVSRDHRWEVMYQRLRNFYYNHGHSRVPQKWHEDKQLALWVQVQRRMFTQGKLKKDREQKLREVEFVWSIQTVFDAQWQKHFDELVAFYKKHGHTRVPSKQAKLVGWMERQRLAKSRGQLSKERVKMLEGIKFIWDFKDIKQKAWEDKFKQLKEFWRENGHAFVPVNYKENKSLGTWVASQRWLEAKGKLDPAKKKKLDQLGFVWSKDTEKELKAINDEKWEESFSKLKAYKEKYGTCQVSLRVDRVLQRWTCWQRKAFYEGKLPQDRLNRLNELRFPWSIQEGYWMKMYDALLAFKKKYGHTRVPFQWKENHKLADWVYRTKVNKDSLEVQKVELLDEIGFDWSLVRRNVIPWKEMYARLITFKQKYGHTKVPVKWEKDPKLGKWVSRMRNERETMEPERVALLEAIEFDWGYKFVTKKEKVVTG